MVEPGTAVLGPGQIRDANRSMLIAAATKAGAKVWGKGGGGMGEESTVGKGCAKGQLGKMQGQTNLGKDVATRESAEMCEGARDAG